MAKILDKIDNWLIATITKLTVHWIKKNKYTKHHVDFFITMTGWECAYWVAQYTFTLFFKGTHSIGTSVIWGLVTAVIIGMEYMKIRMLQDIKQAYDELWERRKNPIIYAAVKDLTDHYINAEHHRKQRHVMLIIFIIATIFLGIFQPLIVPVYLMFILNSYRDCIFDFDPPEKKEKREKDSVTDLVMNSWKQLIGALAPSNV